MFKATHSRREADSLIASGRVTVNNIPVISKGGILVQPYEDVVHLDGKLIEGWEVLNSIARVDEKDTSFQTVKDETKRTPPESVFQYIKYWKPIGAVCTTDQKVPGNIIDQLKKDGFEPDNRIYPVGRLDKDTTGLLVLTNDGRVPNSFLRSKHRKSKIYEAVVNRPIGDDDIEQLKVSELSYPLPYPLNASNVVGTWKAGVEIYTETKRNGIVRSLTAKTLPSLVDRLSRRAIRITIVEGRNRQVRKMLAALGYEVIKLHRVSFGGIGLYPLEAPGDWIALNDDEIRLIQNSLHSDRE